MPPHRCRTDRLDPAADRDGLDRRGFAWGALLLVIEMARPVIAERSKGGTPWHAHHIAERYGLLTIITFGEGVIGTVASLGAVVESQGWTPDAALVAVAGTGLTFGLWWMYFTAPAAEVLHVYRERLFPWGYGHMLIFGSIAATGARLTRRRVLHRRRGAYRRHCHRADSGGAPHRVHAHALRAVHVPGPRRRSIPHRPARQDRSAARASRNACQAVCLVVLMLAPLVPVIGYETLGYRHMATAVQRTLARSQQAIR
jgi:hypothetical protein